MREILPRVFHWTALHPRIRIEVSSYYLVDGRTLLDPLVPAEGLEAFSSGVDQIILTNRHHYRGSAAVVKRYGCAVRCVESGMHEFVKGEKVEPFRFGETLPGGIVAIEIGELCPDETALFIPVTGGAVAIADGVIRDGDGPLRFVTDEHLGDDPEGVKRGLKRAYRRLAAERVFDHLLLAHGNPWVGGAREALARFAAE